MLSSFAPTRQQAHALVDRMTPHQLSALIDLVEPLTPSGKPNLSRAPFCDELPSDAYDVGAWSPVRRGEQPPKYSAASALPSDLDTWPASMMSRSSFTRTTAA